MLLHSMTDYRFIWSQTLKTFPFKDEKTDSFSYCSDASIVPWKSFSTLSSCIFTQRAREVLLCFWRIWSFANDFPAVIWKKLVPKWAGRWRKHSLLHTCSSTAVSLGSYEYLDNCWTRLMCTLISGSYQTPLEGLCIRACQEAPGFQYCSECPIALLRWRCVFCRLHTAARAYRKHCCVLFFRARGRMWAVIRPWMHLSCHI